jgi:hypothetical protein
MALDKMEIDKSRSCGLVEVGLITRDPELESQSEAVQKPNFWEVGQTNESTISWFRLLQWNNEL